MIRFCWSKTKQAKMSSRSLSTPTKRSRSPRLNLSLKPSLRSRSNQFLQFNQFHLLNQFNQRLQRCLHPNSRKWLPQRSSLSSNRSAFNRKSDSHPSNFPLRGELCLICLRSPTTSLTICSKIFSGFFLSGTASLNSFRRVI